MTLDMTRATLKMKSVRAACRNAPDGPSKDAALKHYRTAENEHLAQREAATNRELDAATRALALGTSSQTNLVAALLDQLGLRPWACNANAVADLRRTSLEIGGS